MRDTLSLPSLVSVYLFPHPSFPRFEPLLAPWPSSPPLIVVGSDDARITCARRASGKAPAHSQRLHPLHVAILLCAIKVRPHCAVPLVTRGAGRACGVRSGNLGGGITPERKEKPTYKFQKDRALKNLRGGFWGI